MSKKVKVLVSLVAVVLLVLTGATAAVMAQEEPATTAETGVSRFLDRVAEILDIPQDELIDAFSQARQELGEEACLGKIDMLLARGLITQDEADQVMECWQQKARVMSRMRLSRSGAAAASGQRYLWQEHHGGYGAGQHCPLAD